jgi:hypothetical protein
VFDAVGTSADVATKTVSMIGNIVDAGHSYTQVWRETAIKRGILAIAEAEDVAIAEASTRHVERMSQIDKLTASEKKAYGDYVTKCKALLTAK